MKKLAKLAGTLPFAHMLGVKAAAAEEDDEKKKEYAKKAEDESEEAKAEAEDEKKDDADEDDKKESKKATKAEKEENDDDEENEKAAASAERARCKAIVAHGVKTGQVVHACAYAFDTEMSVDAAVATLDANLAMQSEKPSGKSLAERMAAVETPVVQPEGDKPAADSPQALAAMVIAAASKARGEKV